MRLGARENGRAAAGSFGAVNCFSFHPRKIITTGEGGMLVTNDANVAEFARVFRNHGQQAVDGAFQFVMPGDNLRLTDMQGAVGVSQMARLAGLVVARSRLANRYDDLLLPLAFHHSSAAPGQRSSRTSCCARPICRRPK